MARRQTFSTQELGLLDAIHAEPRSDELRLIYADWLEDHGQPEYAEFIRLQIDRATRGGSMAMVSVDHFLRESRLVKLYQQTWSRPIPKGFQYVEFWRGLPRIFPNTLPDTIDAASSILDRMSPRSRLSINLYGIDRLGEVLGVIERLLARTDFLKLYGNQKDLEQRPLGVREAQLIASAKHLPKMQRIIFIRMNNAGQKVSKELIEPHVPVEYRNG